MKLTQYEFREQFRSDDGCSYDGFSVAGLNLIYADWNAPFDKKAITNTYSEYEEIYSLADTFQIDLREIIGDSESVYSNFDDQHSETQAQIFEILREEGFEILHETLLLIKHPENYER